MRQRPPPPPTPTASAVPTALRHVAVGSDVWVGFDGGVARIDEASGRVTGVGDAPTGFGGGLAATSDDVWVHTGGRFPRRVDAPTMEVAEDLQAPEVSGGSALVAFNSVWATAYDAACCTVSRWDRDAPRAARW